MAVMVLAASRTLSTLIPIPFNLMTRSSSLYTAKLGNKWKFVTFFCFYSYIKSTKNQQVANLSTDKTQKLLSQK
jgi:hypothetical protein